jgi:hypothetical protein
MRQLRAAAAGTRVIEIRPWRRDLSSWVDARGQLDAVDTNRLELAANQGLALFTYAAEAGSRSEEALKLLGSWAATIDSAEAARSTDPSTGQPR